MSEPEERLSTIELVLRVVRRESGAFAPLKERLDRDLRAVIARFLSPVLRPVYGVSDVLQESWLKAFRNAHKFRGSSGGEWRAWVRKIVKNFVVSLNRSQCKRELPVVPITPAVEFPIRDPQNDSLELQDARRLLLYECLSKLPTAQREAFTLRKLEKWSIRQIAAHLGRTEVAVGGLIRRATETIHEQLSPNKSNEHNDQQT